MVRLGSPWGNAGCLSYCHALIDLVGDGHGSLGVHSDGSGPSVEDKPLLGDPRLVVSYPQSPLVATNVFMPLDGSVLSHS